MNSTPSSTSFARKPVHVQTEHPRLELGAAPRLLVEPGERLLEGPVRLVASDHDDAVVVGTDHVARVDRDTADHDRDVDRTRRRLDGALARHVSAPHRESHRPEIARVADAGIDHEAADAPRHQRRGEQVAEHPVRRRRGVRDHEDVAGLADLDRGMDHEVVAGVARHGHGTPGHPHVELDRPDVDAEEPAPTDRLVHRGGTDRGERIDGVGGGSLDRAHHDVPVPGVGVPGIRIRHRVSSSTSLGNTRRTLPWNTCSLADASSVEWSM